MAFITQQTDCCCHGGSGAKPPVSLPDSAQPQAAIEEIMGLIGIGSLGAMARTSRPRGMGNLDFSNPSAFVNSLMSDPVYLVVFAGLGIWGYSKFSKWERKARASARRAAMKELHEEYAEKAMALEERYPTKRRR